MKRTILIGGVLCLVLLGGYGITRMLLPTPRQSVAPHTQSPPVTTKPVAPQIRFAAMGDMLAHDSIVNNARTADGYDFTRYFATIKPLYSDADVVFCNPETPAAGTALGISGYPTFNAPSEFPRDLSKVGCNMINLATNHMYDKGQAGIDGTLSVWREQKPLAIAGANSSSADSEMVSYFTKNGLKVAFVAFMDFSNTPVPNAYSVESYHDKEKTKAKLVTARKNADVVIVSAHWGTEDSSVINEDQKSAAQFFADAGVDVVIGTGPHVLQPVARVSGANGHSTLVWYSIGNMLSSQLKLEELTSGVASFTVIKKDGRINVEKLGFQPTFMAYDWPAADRAAEKLSSRTNLMLYPLSDAGDRLKTMFPGETVASRQQYIMKTLGSDSGVTFAP